MICAVAVDVEGGCGATVSVIVGIETKDVIDGVSVTTANCCCGVGVQETAKTRRQTKLSIRRFIPYLWFLTRDCA